MLPAASTGDAVDLAELTDRRDRELPPGRPWLMANMVMSVDGAYALDARSGGLSGEADRRVFRWLRAAADVVLVAAGTARAERYGRPSLSDELRAHRAAMGLSEVPRLCLVSRSLDLPDDLPLLEGDGPPPLVAHPAGAPTDELPPGVEPLAVPGSTHDVDLTALLVSLRADHHAEVVLCEGGPSLLGSLHRSDLIDELFVSLSPVLVGGDHLGLLGGGGSTVGRLRLHRLLTEDDTLFCTYRRRD